MPRDHDRVATGAQTLPATCRRAVAAAVLAPPADEGQAARVAADALVAAARSGDTAALAEVLRPDPTIPVASWTVARYQAGDVSPRSAEEHHDPCAAVLATAAPGRADEATAELIAVSGGLRWAPLARGHAGLVFHPPEAWTLAEGEASGAEAAAAAERWHRRSRLWVDAPRPKPVAPATPVAPAASVASPPRSTPAAPPSAPTPRPAPVPVTPAADRPSPAAPAAAPGRAHSAAPPLAPPDRGSNPAVPPPPRPADRASSSALPPPPPSGAPRRPNGSATGGLATAGPTGTADPATTTGAGPGSLASAIAVAVAGTVDGWPGRAEVSVEEVVAEVRRHLGSPTPTPHRSSDGTAVVGGEVLLPMLAALTARLEAAAVAHERSAAALTELLDQLRRTQP